MLFISRVAGLNKWEVTDTDDGVKEIVGLAGLRNAVSKGVTIMGVTTKLTKHFGSAVIDVDQVEVYQPALRGTSVAAKAYVLRGVDVKVDGNRILSVSFNSDMFKSDRTEIRLSDYGKYCENFIFVGCAIPQRGKKVVFVLDDSLKTKRQTFQRLFNIPGVVVDIRSVKDDKIATHLYEEYIAKYNGNGSLLRERILDGDDRYAFWEGVDVVYHGSRDYVPLSEEVERRVGEKFQAEFEKLSNIELVIRRENICESFAKVYAKRVYGNAGFWRSNSRDFNMVLCNDAGALKVIQDAMLCQYFAFTRFRNFMQAFTPNESIKNSYMNLCNRLNNWIIDEAIQRGWVEE